MTSTFCADEAATRMLGAEFALNLKVGDVVLLEGPLGAGKTTFVKGIVEALGYGGFVRSPTFNLLQAFDTTPPVLHADLYRVKSAAGLGIEEYLDTHVCLIEWPDRLQGEVELRVVWRASLAFEGSGRRVQIDEPLNAGN
jgi:tRNA threonylcarbamoyl adenosine modification protein YjeE